MKNILLVGAGKSATVLINYLIAHAEEQGWKLTVADMNLELAQSKTGDSSHASAVSFDTANQNERSAYIEKADLVISLLPPANHLQIAKSCIEHRKDLLTASYVDEAMRSLQPEIEKNDLLFLCEMGLDPGIDHMSAMALINRVQSTGGKIMSFKSHCGGLVAPESDNNPWHYKISWNPRNILLAGKGGARFREDDVMKDLTYAELFDPGRRVEIPGLGFYCWYPNRDSVAYQELYGLLDVSTFIRTTLRHPDFIYGWKNVVELKLTDETPQYETNEKTLKDFFREHLEKQGFSDWVTSKISERLDQSKQILEKLMTLTETEQEAEIEGKKIDKDFMLVDEKGDLRDLDLDEVKNNAAATVAHKMHEASLTLKQLFYLGMDDGHTQINKGFCSAADVMQLCIENKLALQPGDRDMIIMLHELSYRDARDKNFPAKVSNISSCLVVEGENNLETAMAKTVGLPLGIAARLILDGTIKLKGLQIPIQQEIYNPVLKELAENGISFTEIPG